MARYVLSGGLLYDGGLDPATPRDVVIDQDRIEAVLPTGSTHPDGVRVLDVSGHTVLPGLVEGHAHLTFPSGVGSLEQGFNPPLNVTYFHREHTPDELYQTAARNAKLLLDAGFTSAYSAGSLMPGDTEIRLRDAIAAGSTPGPRLRPASMERDNHFEGHGGTKRGIDGSPAAVGAFVREMAAAGFGNVKLLLSNDDVFVAGGSQMTQYTDAEAAAAHEAAQETGVYLNCHAQSAESVKIAVRNGFRAIYHCSYADDEAVDLLEAHRDDLFVGPAVGIMWANVHEGADCGITPEVAESMGSPASLAAMIELYPELHKRGIRIVPGGDYGFPNNPIGRNARDLGLFVRLFGFSPVEALNAATGIGGELLGRGHEIGRLAPGYLADVLVVRGDPTADVTLLEDTDNIRAIVKDGAFHKGADEFTAATR